MDELLLQEAMQWLADTGRESRLSDAEIAAAIDEHYPGGCDQFERDN